MRVAQLITQLQRFDADCEVQLCQVVIALSEVDGLTVTLDYPDDDEAKEDDDDGDEQEKPEPASTLRLVSGDR